MTPDLAARKWAARLGGVQAWPDEELLELELFTLRERYAAGRIDVRRLELETEAALLRHGPWARV